MFNTSFGNLPQANQGTGLFGNQTSNIQQPQKSTGLFGNTNTTNNMFGNTQPAPGGLFGNSSTTQNTGGIFGATNTNTNPNSSFMNQPAQGQGLFGNQQQPNTMAGGLFGNSNPSPQPVGGLFGAATTTQTNLIGGIFGGQQQNPPQGAGLFGAQPQTGINGGGLFGNNQSNVGGLLGTQQTTGTGLFGQQTNAQQQQQQGLFGAASTNANQAFLGNQQNTAVGGNLFGAPTNTGGTGIFGNTQTQPQPVGGLFNSFAPANQTNNLFGTQQTNSFNANNNKLGGTTWGVPTTLTSTPSGLLNPAVGQSMQPVRSKNTKLDQKHLVKCIAALDQFNGLNK